MGMYFEDFEDAGEFVTAGRLITEADVRAFAELSGDRNPIHLDRAAALQAGFEDRTGRARASYGFSRIYHYTDDNSNVCRHELGHLFGSCDEYEEDGFCNGSGIDCGLCQGWYLSVTANNGNCEKAVCHGTPVACVMINNVDAVCAFTKTHWGWNDDDSNGLLDFANRQTTAGNYVDIRQMFHNGYYYAASTTAGYVAAQQWNSWAVFGLRSPAGTDYDLRMYLDLNSLHFTDSSNPFRMLRSCALLILRAWTHARDFGSSLVN